MATTTNYGLTKPATTDNIDITVLNANFDTIDAKIKEASDSVPDMSGKLDKTGGTMTGTLVAANTAPATNGARNIRAGTTDMVSGTTALTAGNIYLVYDA